MARRPRPKPRKITTNLRLREVIQADLDRKLSPEQIAAQLRRDFPHQPELHVVHETIYQALYIQGRGQLRREVAKALRTGRAMRKPRRQAQQRQPRYTQPMIMISERPAEAADRAMHAYTCCYDNTPDWKPVGFDGLFLAAGFAGHGFKINPTMAL
jgi:IS30 family transposase